MPKITKYCVYQKGLMVPLFSSTDPAKAEAKATYFRTRPKRPLEVEIKVETYTYEEGNISLPGFRSTKRKK